GAAADPDPLALRPHALPVDSGSRLWHHVHPGIHATLAKQVDVGHALGRFCVVAYFEVESLPGAIAKHAIGLLRPAGVREQLGGPVRVIRVLRDATRFDSLVNRVVGGDEKVSDAVTSRLERVGHELAIE